MKKKKTNKALGKAAPYSFKLVIINNPFNVNEREIKNIKVKKAIKNFIPIEKYDEWEVFINNNYDNTKQVDIDYVPQNGDYLIVMPFVDKGGGKNILGIIAGIALSIATMGVGSVLSGGAFMGAGAIGVAGWSVGAMIGAIGFMALGGSLISNLSQSPKLDTSFGTSRDTYYTWSQALTEGEGNSVQVTYGEVRTSGQVIAKHITSEGTKQYLNLLLCGGEGADEISDIQINNNPISNYKDIVVETRLGTNDQTVISNFNDTYFDEPLTYKLNKTDWRTHQTSSVQCQGLEITLEAPSGIYHVKDDGKTSEAWTKVQVQYKNLNSSTWLDWDTVTLKGTNTDAVRTVLRKDNLVLGQYEVRCIVNSVSGTDATRDITTAYWSVLTTIMYDDFCHPNKVLVSIKALATDQISGSLPSVTWKQIRKYVRVWNPNTKIYENKPANNPAWACYDIFHICKNLKNIHTGEFVDTSYGIAKEKIDYVQFKKWADFCDSKNIKYNAVINTASTIFDVTKAIESIGRGQIVQRGTKISCIFDSVSEPVQMFNMSNIIADSFREEYLATKDRANAIEVSYYDPVNNYEQQTFMVYADDYNTTSAVENVTTTSYDAFMTFSQAYKEAKYRLNLNRYLIRTVYFNADIDSIECQVGDVVLVQHDVPSWGVAGARVKEVIDSTSFITNKAIDFKADKQYIVQMQLMNDTIIKRNISPIGDEIDGIITTEIFSINDTSNLEPDIKVTFGEYGKTCAKPFRIKSISRNGDLTASIAAIEYVEAIYEDITNIPQIDYSYLDTSTIDIETLTCKEITYMQPSGVLTSDINISWVLPRNKVVDEFLIYYSTEGENWILAQNTKTSNYILSNVKIGKTYQIKVKTVNGIKISSGKIESVEIKGKDALPSDVANVVAQIDPTDTTKINLKWSSVEDVDIKGYKVFEGTTEIAKCLTDTKYTFIAKESRQYVFKIYAVDNGNNVSAIAAQTSVAAKIEPNKVNNFTVKQLDTDKSKVKLTWIANSETDFAYCKLKIGQDWETGQVIENQIKVTSYEYTLPNEGVFYFMIKAYNFAGNSSIDTATCNGTFIIKPNTPTNGKYIQTETDKSEVTVYWDKISDIDLEEYQVGIGSTWETATNIKTTKELFAKYTFSTSTNYNVMVRAKNIAGYYSSILNIPISIKVEPPDITGFTVSQSDTNRSILKFKWDAVDEKGKIVYEIRQGVNWSNSTLIQENIQTTNFDFTTTSTGTQNFFIKAKNTAGYYSQGYAIATANIVLIPSAPTAGSIVQDYTNKAILNLSWSLDADTDYLQTEVKVGTNWDTATLVSTTKENKTSYTVTKNGTYVFLVRVKNVAGYYSAIMQISAVVVLNPSDVTGFNLVQNASDKRILNFTFNAVKDTDFAYIEIRKGSNWDAATVIKSNITNNFFDYTTATEGTETYLIKAVNKSGNYSVNAGLITKTITLKPSAISNLKAVANVQNKSKLDISWNQSTDTDFNSYELTINSTIVTTKDNSYQYTVPSSGTYTISVRVKSNGGYYSAYTTIIYAAQIEPLDVTGFTITQSIEERSKLTLYWDKINELDFAYIEIRQGISWDNSTLIDTRINTGTSYTVTIYDENEKTYWIKAVNSAGFYSQNAISTLTTAFNLNPTAPTNLTITQDVNDRSNIIVNWKNNGEYDFSENELRIGDTWETATIRKNTKENSIVFNPTTSGDYKFILKSINKAGFFSDEVFTHFYVTLEPATIDNFQAAQNGEDVELQWNISSDADVVSYRIVEGASYDNGSEVAVGETGASCEVPVDTERTYYFHVKALNKSGHYSQSAATAVVTVSNLLPKNVILSYDEISLKSGTATNVEFGTSLINASNFGGRASDYPNIKASEVGGQVVLKLKKNTDGLYPTNGEYLVKRKDVGQVITANVSTLFYATNAFALGGNAKLQFRTSKDAVTWTSWTDFKTALVTFRYLDFKVVFVTVNNTITPEVNTLQINIDVPDTSKTGTATIPVGGLNILYGNTFWTEPAVIAHAVGVGLHTEIQSKNNTSFTVKVLNNSNADVGGKLSWQSIGY